MGISLINDQSFFEKILSLMISPLTVTTSPTSAILQDAMGWVQVPSGGICKMAQKKVVSAFFFHASKRCQEGQTYAEFCAQKWWIWPPRAWKSAKKSCRLFHERTFGVTRYSSPGGERIHETQADRWTTTLLQKRHWQRPDIGQCRRLQIQVSRFLHEEPQQIWIVDLK